MPNEGDVESAYGRVYRFVKPSSTDPGTWRLATPEQQISGGGGQGGSNVTYDFDGAEPIEVDMAPGVGNNPTVVTTAININDLPSDDEI